MVESTQTKQAAEAIRSLFAAGVDEREIHELVTTIAIRERPSRHENDMEDLPIYDELPEGLIDVPAGAEKYGRSTDTIGMWIRRGRLQLYGRRRAAAPGGGYLVVSESGLADLAERAPRRNR